MSADLAVDDQASAARWPGLIIAELTARRAARSAVIWGLVFGLFVATSALVYASTYKTPAQRSQVAATFGVNVGLTAILGPAHRIDTVSGFTAWRSLGLISILGGIWGVLTATRLLRGEEDSGRWELLLVGHTTRRGATAKAIAGLGVGVLTLWGVTATVTVAVGRLGSVHISLGQSLFLALALVCSAGVFLATGALASQLAPTRRQAASYAAGALGLSYALRMIADSGTGLDWLRWLSPLGWVEELRPLTSPQPVLLLPIASLVAAVAALAVHLAGSRDLGASVVADRSRAPERTRLLFGPTGLTIRLTRGTIAGWGVSISLGALMVGLIAKSAGSSLLHDDADREAFAKLGFRGSGAEQYLAIAFLILALLVGLMAASQLSAARNEEADGRVDHLLVRPVSRYRWLAGRLAVATSSLVATGLIAGLSAWLGAASQDTGVGLITLLQAGLNVVPPGVVVLGAGALALGVWPRAVSVVTYGLISWSFLVEIIGGIGNAPTWVLDTSLFHLMAAAPAASPNWTTDAILVACGAAAAAAGAAAFRYRDLVGA